MLTGHYSCDDWFHPTCIGLEEYQCDLLEHFYCESCQRGRQLLELPPLSLLAHHTSCTTATLLTHSPLRVSYQPTQASRSSGATAAQTERAMLPPTRLMHAGVPPTRLCQSIARKNAESRRWSDGCFPTPSEKRD